MVIRDPQTRRTREAEVDIYEPMLNYIEDNAFAEAMDIFMHHFETDIRGRVKADIGMRSSQWLNLYLWPDTTMRLSVR